MVAMRRSTRFLSAVLAASLAASPAFISADAWARAGQGSSYGSRGSRTYTSPPSTNTAPGGAVPMQRSATPNAPSPGYANPGYAQAAPGLSRRGAFTSGLLGGLIGAGIGGLLFGHGLTGGLDGFFSFIGLLLQLALVFFVVRWLIRRFTGGQPAFAGLGAMRRGPAAGGATGGMLGGLGMMRQASGNPQGAMPGGVPGGAQPGQPNLVISPSDYQSFERTLQSVQAAWTAQDMRTLQRLTTPEMAGYFNEQLSEQASRGLRNEVTDVRLDRGDLSEAWSENGRDYATVAMNFSMVDVTRDATGRVVDGNPGLRTTATELWTFVRAPGAQWLVSAIQQTR